MSGEARLTLPSALSAEIRVKTFSGRIQSAFGGTADAYRSQEHGQELLTTVGGGDGSVEVKSFSGRVQLTSK